MSKLFKSKFFLGTLVVAGLVVALGGLKATPAAADCGITMTLKVGSRGAEVMCLQSALDNGLAADGVFGAHTKAAVVAWQKANGLVADGVFGPKSRAVWEASLVGVSYPAGCMSNSGFSSTTGLPCAGGTFPAGCMSNVGYSPTTGAPCNGTVGVTLPAGCATASGFSSTTGQPCTATSVTVGTNGYLTDFASDSTNRVSTVYESDQEKVVAGFRATARLADQTVNRVRVTFTHGGSQGSVNLSKYISSASLWYGSTKIATMAVASADRAISTDVYTFNFSGLSAKIPKDQIGRFYVSVSANGSLDSVDAASASTWTVAFPSGSVQAVSPDGSVDTYDVTAPATFSFGKFSANGVKATVGLSSTNPIASVVTVNSTSATNAVPLLKFTVKATNSDLTLRKIPIQIRVTDASSTATNVSTVINTLKLYRDGVLVDSLDPSASFQATYGSASNTTTACGNTTGAANDVCTFYFSNLSSPANMITSGSTAEFTVVADLKQVTGNYTEGTTIEAQLANPDLLLTANFSVNDVNGDQLTAGSTYRVGSATGEIQTLRVNGVQVTKGAETIQTVTDSGNVVQVTYNIPMTVTAFGQTQYMGQNAVCAAAVTANTQAFAYILQSSAAATDESTANCGTSSSTVTSSDASVEGTSFRIDSGSTKHFTLQVILTTPATASTSYRVAVKQAQTWSNAALTTDQAIQSLVPAQNYKTAYQFIAS